MVTNHENGNRYLSQWEPLLKFFLEACFLFPRALAFDFICDLDLCSQGHAMRAFSFGMGFSLMLSKVQWGF